MSASPRDGAAPGGALPAPLRLARAWLAQARAGEPVLAAFGLAMWLAMIPAAIALGLDERSLRGVSVWVKPLKFMASLGLFALTTAWFVGLEIGYIALQAALGRASHYNFDSPLSAALYSAMGLGALALTFTQAVLAREVVRHGGPLRGDPVRVAIVAGLVLTFLLGAGAGGLLGSMQPPAGTGLPIVGWHPRGDLRPAHFVGLHAQQLLPLAGLALARLAPGRAMPALWAFTLGYVALWAALVAMGLNGATVVAPGRVG
jgi:hypothetical protein